MNNDTVSQYSQKSLRSLEEILEQHGALLWVDPTTNTLSVKHSTQPLQNEETECPLDA
ncbi:hypothetical protein KA082_01325 [Candidatus Woesebacteria bacterium]|nr:hypothetical protein [Candidatus Woesebacteria bacterium]